MNEQQYEQINEIVFSGRYPGYRPEVLEVPNGDGKVDAAKRYAHIAMKYLAQAERITRAEYCLLLAALWDAHSLATSVARALRVPAAFMPKIDLGALRVLEYPIGAVSNKHTDPNLFTVMLYRSHPRAFVADDSVELDFQTKYARALEINPQFHIGEMYELLGLGKATPHEVVATQFVQTSAVYFAIPDHAAVFPNTTATVGEFLQERLYTRGRTTK